MLLTVWLVPLDYKLHVIRDFCLYYLLLYPLGLEQRIQLVLNKCVE